MNCDYIKIYDVKDEEGKINQVKDRCSSRLNLREIEFKHAEYREQNRVCFLCESHFIEVFGDIDQAERNAFRDWQNKKIRYNRDYANARKHAEYFDEQGFKETSYHKVQMAFDKWNDIRKKHCRYEYCTVDLKTIRRVFVIRVYAQSGREWANYYFCSKDHWTKMKYRIGIELPEKKTNVKIVSLDDYTA